MNNLPDIPPRKPRRKPYRKPEAVKQLERLADEAARAKHPNMRPEHLAPRKYRDDTANGLTKCVIDFIRLMGGQAERINTVGRYIDKSKRFQDVTGRVRTIGSGQWIPTSGQRGSADISATIGGRAVKVEIKMKDKQSAAQKEYQRQIEAAGGVYLIVKTFAEFKEWFESND